jgi:hypothetical protein
VVLAGAAVLLVILVPSGPFEFLAGTEPLPVRDARQLKQMGIDTERLKFYSLKADFEPLVKKVGDELKNFGFKIDPDSGKNFAAFNGPKKGQRITFQNNARRLDEVSVRSLMTPGSGEPGRVIIALEGIEEPGLLYQFKQWLGL